MNRLIVKNDFKRNKIINLALLLFIIISTVLAVLSVTIGVESVTSISEMYQRAEPPHFLQMHKGDLDQNKIDEFMQSHEGVSDWQTQKMLNVYGENLTIVTADDSYDLSDSRLDIGLVKQNESKDLLLNNQHEKIILSESQIGMPILLKERYDFKIGDEVILSSNGIEKRFTITEFVLDAQMNSSMVSSTRILLSDEDYHALEDTIGENEYIIETYFTDRSLASDFQTDYENAGLPRNGPTITYAMMFLLSALTDIVVVFLLFTLSILLIIISFICIRFTIMASLEEEIFEIGTMKAIGLKYADIRNIYLHKYLILAAIGVTLGTLFALILRNLFTQHMNNAFGNMNLSPWTVVLSLLMGFIVYCFIVLYCMGILKKIKNLTVIDAMVLGHSFDQSDRGVRDGLHQSKKLDINWTLALRDVFYNFKHWAIVFTVVLIAAVIILIPIHLLNTFKSPDFITYMGSSQEDILIEVESGENLESNYLDVKNILIDDPDIETYDEFRRVTAPSVDSEGRITNLHIDSGLNSGHELHYLDGNAPQDNNELALSYLNANKLEKEAGDQISLSLMDGEEEFLISGIYQDVTSGGYTAKAVYPFSELNSYLYTFSVNLKDPVRVNDKVEQWSKSIHGGVSIDSMEEVIDQTLGGVVDQLEVVVLAITLVGIAVSMLIVVLFLKLRLTRDLPSIATLRAIGFSNRDVRTQYMIKMGIVSTAGILFGVLLTNLLGERLINLVLSISGLGIKEVHLITHPLQQYIIWPAVLVLLILIVTRFVFKTVEKYNLMSVINE